MPAPSGARISVSLRTGPELAYAYTLPPSRFFGACIRRLRHYRQRPTVTKAVRLVALSLSWHQERAPIRACLSLASDQDLSQPCGNGGRFDLVTVLSENSIDLESSDVQRFATVASMSKSLSTLVLSDPPLSARSTDRPLLQPEAGPSRATPSIHSASPPGAPHNTVRTGPSQIRGLAVGHAKCSGSGIFSRFRKTFELAKPTLLPVSRLHQFSAWRA
jgi:hypothetical protein